MEQLELPIESNAITIKDTDAVSIKINDIVNPLITALDVTDNARRASYGHPFTNFSDIAEGWSILLAKKRGERFLKLTPEEVSLMMIWLKLCREAHKEDFDNLVDMAGYTNTLHMVKEYRKHGK